ncbi:MAG: hypothetical protein IJT96_10195 [Lachnospiraceae bacterium]|nr:hypothetical protein [Lachnospiraceae bacterium]
MNNEKFKELNNKQKLQYIWDYYKIPIIIAIILIFAIISFVRNRLEYKPTVFNLVMIDSNVTELIAESLLDGFADYCEDFDPDTQQISLHADYDSSTFNQGIGIYSNRQKILAEYSVGTIDATIAPKDVIEELAESQAFGDLSEILPKAMMDEIISKGYDIIHVSYEDPATGEVHDFPAAINISESLEIQKGFTDINGKISPYFNEDCYYAISPNSSYLEHDILFLEYLIMR